MRISSLIQSITLGVFLTLNSLSSIAQSEKEVLLAGKIINQESKEIVPFANVYLNNSRMGVVADEWGVYKITLHAGDSIVVSAMGYKDYTFKLESSTKKDQYQDIFIKQTTYMLADVNVYNMGTYQQFKQDLIHMKIEKTQKQKLAEQICMDIKESIKESYKNAPLFVEGGISLGKPRAQKVKERREAYARAQERSKILATKYNKDIVAQIIGENEREKVDKFMVYINTHSNFSDKTSQRHIIQSIKRMYLEYTSLYPEEIKCKRDTSA